MSRSMLQETPGASRTCESCDTAAAQVCPLCLWGSAGTLGHLRSVIHVGVLMYEEGTETLRGAENMTFQYGCYSPGGP